MSRVLIVLSLFVACEATGIEIIAHRGYTCGALENTVRSVEYAWLAGADGVELDLRVSGDGVIFLYHDDNVDGRPIATMDYADIVGQKRSNAPELREVLELGEPPGYFVLDLKESDPAKYQLLPSLINESGINEDRFVIQSASINALVSVKALLPEAHFYYLSHLKRRFPLYRTPKPKRVLSKINGLEIDGVSLKGRRFVDENFVKEIRNAGYQVIIWTINDPIRASFYRDIGVDGLITDSVEEIRSETVEGVSFQGQCLNGVRSAS